MGIIYVSKYLLRHEYQCPCCSTLPPDYDEPYGEPFSELFDSFALIRKTWGAPLNISSGYRCPRHNSFVGGRPLSAHQFGLALDIDVESYQVERLTQIIDEVAPDLRMCRYPGFVHVDVAYHIYPRAVETWEKGYRWSNDG